MDTNNRILVSERKKSCVLILITLKLKASDPAKKVLKISRTFLIYLGTTLTFIDFN